MSSRLGFSGQALLGLPVGQLLSANSLSLPFCVRKKSKLTVLSDPQILRAQPCCLHVKRLLRSPQSRGKRLELPLITTECFLSARPFQDPRGVVDGSRPRLGGGMALLGWQGSC